MRARKAFSEVQQWSSGAWYAVAKRAGLCSGPWETREEAQIVVDKWNHATMS